MNRLEKTYATMDALVSEFQQRLVAEFEVEFSWYLEKKQRVDDKGRIDNLRGKAGNTGAFVKANQLLTLEKDLRQLCLKLNEPSPLPIQLLDEYIASHQRLREQKTVHPWKVDEFKGELISLKRQIVQKLLNSEQGKP